MNISIKYDGKGPTLCYGTLIAVIDGKKWVFPDDCLLSGGSIKRSKDWDMWATKGKWSITDWPADFPQSLQQIVIDAVNDQIPHGCCGGCI